MSYIKIGFIGCISSGKSTILNCIFGCNLSPMGIDRTTMLPTEYRHHCSYKETTNQDIANILNRASITNKSLKNNVTPEDLVTNLESINLKNFSLKQKYAKSVPDISVFDFPGLNDSMFDKSVINFSLDKLRECHLIVLVVDVKSGLNSRDEIQLLENVAKIRAKQNKLGFNSDIIVAINKWDQPCEELKALKTSIKITAKNYIKDAQFSLISSLKQFELMNGANLLTATSDELWTAFINKINSNIEAHLPNYYLYNLKLYAKGECFFCTPLRDNYHIIDAIKKNIYKIEKSLDCKYSHDDLDFIHKIYKTDINTGVILTFTLSSAIFICIVIIIFLLAIIF